MKNHLSRRIKQTIFTILVLIYLPVSAIITTPCASYAADATLAAAKTPNHPDHGLKGYRSGCLIVQLKGKPLAGLYAETAEKNRRPGVRRMAAGSRAAEPQRLKLRQQQDAFVKKLQNLVPEAKVSRRQNYRGTFLANRYQLLFNGVSINPGTANREALLQTLRQMQEVKAVYPDRIYRPALFSSRELINAEAIWKQSGDGMATAGRGVKIAIIDAGIHHLSPMFSGKGFNYPPEIPAPGLGDPRNNNGKIIVSRAYFCPNDPPLPGDAEVWPGTSNDSTNTHGVHVAGIAAGNPVSADFYGLKLDLGGVAPGAWLMSYRIFYTSQNGQNFCYTSALLAAIEDAVADGADIINLSVAGEPLSVGGYYDPVDQALIYAARTGVFIATAGGNTGPDPGTLEWPSAAYTTVAAGTKAVDPYIAITLSLSAPQPIPPELDEIDYEKAEFGPYPAGVTTSCELVSAAAVTPANPDGCQPWNGRPFANKAVLIERGGCDFDQKVFAAQQAGASMVIIYNNEAGGDEIFHMTAGANPKEVTIPAFFIGHHDGRALCDWGSAYGAAARIETRMFGKVQDGTPDRVRDFSSRGPGVGEVLKPDLMAPGARIVSQGAHYGYQGEERCFHYGVKSGTSMAVPHVAGAAALIRQLRPQWPVSYIKSALMTTAEFRNIKTENGQPAVPLEIGAGRLNLSRVTDPGIICRPPSVSFGRLSQGRNRSLTVTITNITDQRETYTISTFAPRGSGEQKLEGVSFSPAQLTLEPGAAGTLTLTITTADNHPEVGDLQGYVILQGRTHQAHLPLWARIIAAPEEDLLLIDNDGSSRDPENFRDYRRYYTDALDQLGKSYTVWDADTRDPGELIPPATILSHYPGLIYFTGDNYAPDTMRSIYRLREYANGGGRILAMGLNMKFFFDEAPKFDDDLTAPDSLFAIQAFWDLIWEILPPDTITGHKFGPAAFSDIRLDIGSPGDGAANQFELDVLGFYSSTPKPRYIRQMEYQPLLYYPYEVESGNYFYDGTVAIGHRNQPRLELPEPTFTGSTIYTSFGLEGVNNREGFTSRSQLLGSLIDWLDDKPVVTVGETTSSTPTRKTFRAQVASPVKNVTGVSYRWDFGEGGAAISSGTTATISHTYSRPGNYLVRVEATDSFGNHALGKYLVSQPHRLYYPHIATVDGWQTETCLINTSPDQTLHGNFLAYNSAGLEVADLKGVVLPPHGRMQVTLEARPDDPEVIEYIIFNGDLDSMVGYTKFYIPGSYRAAIPAVRKLNQNDLFISHIASTDNWFTGLSLINVTASARTLFLESDNGLKRTLELAPGEHQALSIRSLFDSRPQPGIKSAVIRNCAGIIGLELFGSDQQLSGILLRDNSAKEIIYPHVVSSATWGTGVAAYNCATATGHLNFTTFDDAGEILSQTDRDLNGHKKFIGSAASLGFPEETAWFRIKSTQPLTGFELFGTSNGQELAGYSGVDISGTQGVFAKLEKSGFTGIAIVNTSELPAQVILTAYDDSGQMVGNPETTSLAGHEKVAKVAEELFDSDIDTATYITYNADRKIAGFQLNGSNDGSLLDGLPALR